MTNVVHLSYVQVLFVYVFCQEVPPACLYLLVLAVPILKI